MTNKFKVGDIVHRTEPADAVQRSNGMEIGGHYVVESLATSDASWITLEGVSGQYHCGCFKLSDRATTAVKDIRALSVQHGGTHYKKLAIQPVEYIMANGIPYMEGNAIKYLTRWRDKGGVQDLNKAKHYIEMLIENEEKTNGAK